MNLPELLTKHRPVLVRYFERNARSLRRYEAAEDLAQGVHLHAVRHEDRFEYQGEKPFVSWLLHLAQQHLADRIAHWKALKRDAGPMMRITYGAGATAGVNPVSPATGPITHASRQEQLRVAALAMDGLPARDRQLVQMVTSGASIESVAERLRISPAAAQKARLRALDRFRKIYEIVLRRSG